jgi:EpsI family protein
MLIRASIVLALLGAAAVYGSTATGPETPVGRAPLSDLPITIDQWRGYSATPFADDVVAELGVDDYTNRRYMKPGGAPIAVYVGYYASQREGDAIHSPRNCLPGAGWSPRESGRQDLPLGNGRVTVNRYLIARGLDRQMVLYWYQGRNRVVASDYANKLLLMMDAGRLRRTNGGLVRLITPVVSTPAVAGDELTGFATALLPLLPRYLP